MVLMLSALWMRDWWSRIQLSFVCHFSLRTSRRAANAPLLPLHSPGFLVVAAVIGLAGCGGRGFFMVWDERANITAKWGA